MSEAVGYPTAKDYHSALLNFQRVVKWSRISNAIPQRAGISFFIGQGNFAIVTKVLINNEEWALRLPLKRQVGSDIRYSAISNEVMRGNPVFVPVEYSSDALEVPIGSGVLRSAVLMKWVSGTAVREYTINLCKSSDVARLKALRDAFVSLSGQLLTNKVVHGDLSPDNILVTENGGSVLLQLVDYDSVQIIGLENIPSSVGRTPMRHPKCPMMLDAQSDAFPFLIYYSVLTALIANPSLGKSPDYYDQKFLIDSPTLGELPTNARVLALQQAAPDEISALLTAVSAPYEETPSISGSLTSLQEKGPLVLASDWLDLTNYDNQIVEINGLIKRITELQELVITTPSKINRGLIVSITDKRGHSLRTTNGKFQVGEFICAVGKLEVSENSVKIQASQIEKSAFFNELGYSEEFIGHIQKRIKDSLSRIRQKIAK